MIIHSTAKSADVAMLLEGTFPYVSGGVSSWVNQIIRGFPNITFALVFLGSRAQDYGEMRYQLPDNVVHLEVHYVHANKSRPPIRELEGNQQQFEWVAKLHEWFRAPRRDAEHGQASGELFQRMLGSGLTEDEFLYSKRSWNYISEQYRKHSTDPSFVDYFWTIRAMHEPIWTLRDIARNLIPVRAYHSISTGYAGFLGALLKQQWQRPYILTEHGIYTKERKIDLYQANWVTDNRDVFQRDPTEVSYFRKVWIRFFEGLGRVAYDAADIITALYEQNRRRQVEDGAQDARTRVIPNGIALERFAPLRAKRSTEVPKVLCLIGRVVPIKDVKTFIRAMRTVVNHLPDAEGWIAGPEDEDPGYARECRELAEGLGLAANVKFLGFQKVEDVLPKVGVLVLSSISEALPLVLLEGYAAGVPAVTTDVGSCNELVHGSTPEDQALGASGRVVRIADPQALADAALSLLTDAQAWTQASRAGIQRVEAFYTQQHMFKMYREVYDQALLPPGAAPAGERDAVAATPRGAAKCPLHLAWSKGSA
jgi:polysaccharide biosynthesis protein PelF